MVFKACDAAAVIPSSRKFLQAVRQGTPIPLQKFTQADDLRHRLRAVWRDVVGVNHATLNAN
eukprot:452847-Pelagomonas_calceolata.AAC.1